MLETSNLSRKLIIMGADEKKFKIRSKGSGRVVTRPTLEFGAPFRISGAAGARNFKFGTQIDTRGTNEKKCKIRSKG